MEDKVRKLNATATTGTIYRINSHGYIDVYHLRRGRWWIDASIINGALVKTRRIA